MTAVLPHLPALQVILPLFGAFLAAFLRRGAMPYFDYDFFVELSRRLPRHDTRDAGRGSLNTGGGRR